MAYKISRNPALPTPPKYHDPKRCHRCGHVGNHQEGVGCLVPGGTKWIEDEKGKGYGACSCLAFVPVPDTILKQEEISNGQAIQ